MTWGILLALCVGVSGCAARRPAYVVVPRAEVRSEEPVTLPLTAQGRARLMSFLEHGGRPKAPAEVKESMEQAQAHREALDALEKSENLSVQTTNPRAREFCDDAAKLCGQAALFRKKPVVRQVVDARQDRRPFPAPLAVPDGPYWWIFHIQNERLTEVLLVRAVERDIQR